MMFNNFEEMKVKNKREFHPQELFQGSLESESRLLLLIDFVKGAKYEVF